MSAGSTHFKLGILTVLALAALFAIAFGLGWRGVRSTKTITYHTYFDESVQGLDLGSPVKYRGVPIGTVSAVQIAPDQRHVDVALALEVEETRRLGLTEVKPDVRAQLGTQGITGVKFVDINLFDPKANPPPELSFPPAEHYIPSTRSLLEGLANNLEVIGQHLPELIDATSATMRRIETVLTSFDDQRLPDRLATTVEHIDGAVVDLRGILRHFDGARIPDKLGSAAARLDETVAQVNGVLEGLGGDGGLLASTQRATDSIGDLGRSASGSAAKLERTLRDLDEAATAVRRLAEAIEREPDMLVKGRAKGKR